MEFTYPRTLVKTKFKITVNFTTFGRIKVAYKFNKTAIKLLYSKGLG
jgi:hypothetical protein